MHLRLDDEILELERRIAVRKADLQHGGRVAGHRALNGLASPAALVTALAVGFAAGGGLHRKRRNGVNGRNGANGRDGHEGRVAAGLGSLLMTGATWFIKAQFGSPAGMARALLSKIQARRA